LTTTLRPYQTEARYQCNTLLNAGRHPLFQSPTGTGKTKTAVAIIADRIALGRRVWILCPQSEIFDQWVLELTKAELNPGTINSDGIKGRNRAVYVVMPLSAINLLSYISESLYPHEIITDECHHSAASTWEEIYAYFPRALRFGLTATPRRTDGKGLDHLYTDIVSTISMAESIDSGYLARPLCIVPEQYHIDVGIKSGDYDPQEQARLLGKTQIVGDVIANYGHVFNGLPVLVACSTFEHASMMSEAFNKAGWKFEHIHSGLPDHARKRMLREIRTGKLHGLCTVGIGIEGMDIPGLYGLIWLRRTLSLTIYLQFIGRVLRPMEGKEYGIILDPVGNLFIHCFPETERSWTLAGDSGRDVDCGTAPTMRICGRCGVANAYTNTTCHFCGATIGCEDDGNCEGMRNRRHLPAIIDGNLIAITSDGMAEALYSKRGEAHGSSANLQANGKHNQIENKQGQSAHLTTIDKRAILRRGLFDGKRPLFEEAVRGMK
jgi:superfamily II DNA or RNA helicase